MRSHARFDHDRAGIFARDRSGAFVDHLVRVSIAVGVLGTIGLVAEKAFATSCHGSSVATTQTNARSFRAAAEIWRADQTSASPPCPTFADLVRDRAISPTSRDVDGWNQPLFIACDGDDVTVTSAGNDGMLGTSDDIRMPEPRAEGALR